MRRTNVFISAGAAGALVLGSIGMASATQDAGHHAHGFAGERPAAGDDLKRALPKLVGKVTDAANITLSDTTLNRGRYKIVVRDSTANHNWHVFGTNVDQETSIPGTGRSVFRVRFRVGTYTVQCDKHPATMNLDVHVS
ncbi:MAG TPA: hypothetical protein VFX15_04780 [Actinomycetes bacterium]|nr:hypothetical protein [Actinomycetes bacterium]